MAHFAGSNLILTFLFTGFALQIAVAAYVILALKNHNKEQTQIYREIYGLAKRIEGLTSSRREQVVREYDRLVENLSTRLPIQIASRASEAIFETESKILQKLAEIEPSLVKDAKTKERLDDLIKSMEQLEHTVVSLTSNTVQQIMLETRGRIIDDTSFDKVSIHSN